MDDKALATIVRDLEAQAVVYIANLGKIGTPNVHLWRRELARLRGFAPENANFGIFGTAKYLICRG
jgi:hypothetical protein